MSSPDAIQIFLQPPAEENSGRPLNIGLDVGTAMPIPQYPPASQWDIGGLPQQKRPHAPLHVNTALPQNGLLLSPSNAYDDSFQYGENHTSDAFSSNSSTEFENDPSFLDHGFIRYRSPMFNGSPLSSSSGEMYDDSISPRSGYYTPVIELPPSPGYESISPGLSPLADSMGDMSLFLPNDILLSSTLPMLRHQDTTSTGPTVDPSEICSSAMSDHQFDHLEHPNQFTYHRIGHRASQSMPVNILPDQPYPMYFSRSPSSSSPTVESSSLTIDTSTSHRRARSHSGGDFLSPDSYTMDQRGRSRGVISTPNTRRSSPYFSPRGGDSSPSPSLRTRSRGPSPYPPPSPRFSPKSSSSLYGAVELNSPSFPQGQHPDVSPHPTDYMEEPRPVTLMRVVSEPSSMRHGGRKRRPRASAEKGGHVMGRFEVDSSGPVGGGKSMNNEPWRVPIQPAEGSDVSSTTSHFKSKVGSQKIQAAAEKRRTKPATFVCDQPNCSSSFTARHNLNNHLNSHQNKRFYSCDHCGQSFGTQGVLNRHVNTCPKARAELQASGSSNQD